MKSSLFDTNVVSIYVGQRARKRHPEVVRLVGETLKTQGLYIATITMYELRRGVRKLRLKGQGRRKEESRSFGWRFTGFELITMIANNNLVSGRQRLWRCQSNHRAIEKRYSMKWSSRNGSAISAASRTGIP